MDKLLGWSILFMVFLIIILISPVLTIWSLNTLFNTGIEINLWTYSSTLWLTGLVAGSSVRK